MDIPSIPPYFFSCLMAAIFLRQCPLTLTFCRTMGPNSKRSMMKSLVSSTFPSESPTMVLFAMSGCSLKFPFRAVSRSTDISDAPVSKITYSMFSPSSLTLKYAPPWWV